MKVMSDRIPQTITKRAQARYTVPITSIRKIEADGVQVFYRMAGDPSAPVVLLLHGFPASSFMFRELIPRLADQYRVIAPDLAGFGFTEVPAQRNYKYSFDALAQTLEASAWQWLTRNESEQSFHRTEMRMKKALAMPGVRSGNIRLSPQQKTAK